MPYYRLFDISFDDGIETNAIVLDIRTNIVGQGGGAKWCIVGNNVAKSVSQTATDKSNTAIKGKIQFVNDIPLNENLVAPFDFEFQAPTQVGDQTDGNRAYGGMEEGEDGIQRHYKWIWHEPSPLDGYLIPGTSREYDNVDSLNKINEMWIQLDHRFNGQTCEIHHRIINIATFEESGRFNVNVDVVEGKIWVSATDGGTTDIPCEFDAKGHLRRLNDTYNTETDDPYSEAIEVTGSTAPSSGSLYDVSVSQTANIIDIDGVDTNAFNGDLKILYTTKASDGTVIDIGFVSSTSGSLPADATEYNGAGTGGNNTEIRMDLSKQLDGKDILLTAKLVDQRKSDVGSITGIESVQLVPTIETVPVPDNVAFNVKVELQHGGGGTAAQGTRFSRFDGGNEYRIQVFIFLESDKENFDREIANTYIQETTAIVVDKTTFSGNTVSFTIDFPITDEGAEVCARVYLEFFQAAAPPPPLGNQIGICNIFDEGDFAEDCQVIAGTGAVGSLATDDDVYNPASILPNVKIGGITFRSISPIVVTFTINKGGDTTDFSTANIESQLKLFRNDKEIFFTADEDNPLDPNNIDITNPIFGTDGFSYVINFIDDSEIKDGDIYELRVVTPGVTDQPNKTTFTFNTAGAFPATDFFGSRVADLPFPWFDFGGGDSTLQSNGLEGTEPFDTRWSRSNGGLNDPEGENLVNGVVTVVVEDPSVSSERAVYTSNAAAITGAFEISGDFNITPVITVSNRGPFSYFEMDIAGSRFNIGWAQGVGLNGLFYAFNGVDTQFEEQESGGFFNFKISRDTNDLVEVFLDNNTIASVTKAGDLTNVDVWFSNGGGGAGTPSGATFTFSNFEFKVENSLGSLVDFWSPNEDRWTQSVTGTAYQIVDRTSNKLDHIIPSSAGTDTVRLLSNFSADKNIFNSLNSFLFTEKLSNMAFPNSGDEVFLQVTNTNSDVWQIGFKNTGSGQFFFIDIGGGDISTVAGSPAAATIAIEFGRSGGNNVEFLLNGVIKHTLVDPGFDITDIDLFGTTTATGSLIDSVDSIDVQAPTGTQWTFSP